MNEFIVTVLEDGRVVVESSRWGQKEHLAAERFLADLPGLLGGQVVKVSRLGRSVGVHAHTHEKGHHHHGEDV